MAPFFSVHVDPSLSLVHVTVSGFFSSSDVDALIQARDAGHAQLRCAPNEHVTLVDMRDMAIQSQETVVAFRKTLTCPRARSRRLAFVTSKSLARMQIERASEGRAGLFFTDVEEARAWLLSPLKQAA